MLRPVLNAAPHKTRETWRVSEGSAAVLGLRPTFLDAPPTTAYLMLGERCAADCGFCAQARTSTTSTDRLSRVKWPLFETTEVIEAIAKAYDAGAIKRACFQTVSSPGYYALAQQAVAHLAATSPIPICVSIHAQNLSEIRALLEAGAERVTIALDAASPQIYREVKGGSWEQTWRLLQEAAVQFPHRIGTHLIAGLGETEEELLNVVQALLRMGITIGLFAFTPLPGTRLADRPRPPIESYRRIQAGLWLLREGLARIEEWRFVRGRLVDYGMTSAALSTLLANGEAFRTAGCPDCNRPYYNERPSGPLYNYPRPLTPEEAQNEIARLCATLEL